MDRDGNWARDFHEDVTRGLAIDANYSSSAANKIAVYNNETDGGFFGFGTGFLPGWLFGEQSRHLNTNKHGTDSRLQWLTAEYSNAVNEYNNGNIDKAYKHLGRALHSVQDFYAHRNWDTGILGLNRHPGEYDVLSRYANSILIDKSKEITRYLLEKFKKDTSKKD